MKIFLPLLIIVLLIVGVTYLFIYNLNKQIILPLIMPSEGFSIPIAYAYIGSRNWNVHNGLNPKLVLFEDKIKYRVIYSKEVKLSEIESLDLSRSYNSILFKFKNGNKNFVAYTNPENVKQLARYFASKGVSISYPKLNKT